jgi:hypothetical protein
MLTALETGVKGGRWHTLIDKVFAMQDAADRVLMTIELESRMREICTSGLEGGAVEPNRPLLPLSRALRARSVCQNRLGWKSERASAGPLATTER